MNNNFYVFCMNEYYWCYTDNPFIAYNFVLSLDIRDWNIKFEVYEDCLPDYLEDIMNETGRYMDKDADKLEICDTRGIINLKTITTKNMIEENLYETGMNEKYIISFIQSLCNLHKLSPYIRRDGFRQILSRLFDIYGKGLWDYCNNERVDGIRCDNLYILLKEEIINPLESFRCIEEGEIKDEINRIISGLKKV